MNGDVLRMDDLPECFGSGFGTARAFLAAVAEAGYPARFVTLWITGPAYGYQLVATGSPVRRAVGIPCVEVRWTPPMPDEVGRRARDLTGLSSAWPTRKRLLSDAWVIAVLADEPT